MAEMAENREIYATYAIYAISFFYLCAPFAVIIVPLWLRTQTLVICLILK